MASSSIYDVAVGPSGSPGFVVEGLVGLLVDMTGLQRLLFT